MSDLPADPRCLVADDHPALLAAVCSYLAEQGFELVGSAADGRQAVALAAQTKPDVALVDFRMPRLGGCELVRQLREASPGTAIAVYTADADEQIGSRLGITAETVRSHVRKASSRLGATTRTQAVATALRLGLIS